MKVINTVCDAEGCKAHDAERISMFKERKADGAGGMENWYYTFDLCARHTLLFLRDLLEKITKHSNGISEEHVLEVARFYKIKYRVE